MMICHTIIIPGDDGIIAYNHNKDYALRDVGILFDGGKAVCHWWFDTGQDLYWPNTKSIWYYTPGNYKHIKDIKTIDEFKEWYVEKYFVELI